ncbi:hypothetical protein V8C44DRAFT_213770 [Trichoderma aethiopicum]
MLVRHEARGEHLRVPCEAVAPAVSTPMARSSPLLRCTTRREVLRLCACTTERRQGNIERLPAEGWGACASEYIPTMGTTREWSPRCTPIAAVLSGAISLPRHGPLAGVASGLHRSHCSSRTLPALFWNRRRSRREIEAGTGYGNGYAIPLYKHHLAGPSVPASRAWHCKVENPETLAEWKLRLWAMKPSRSSMGLGCGMPNWPCPSPSWMISRTCARHGDALARCQRMPLHRALNMARRMYHGPGSGSVIGSEQPKH